MDKDIILQLCGHHTENSEDGIIIFFLYSVPYHAAANKIPMTINITL